MRILGILCAAILALSAEVHADAVAEGFALARQALEADKKGDAAAAADLFAQALQRRPNHPGLTLNLAGASLKAGRTEDAIAALDDYAAMGLNADLTRERWKPLATHPRWQALLARFAANAKPVGEPTVAATIADPKLIAEGLAYDKAENRFYVGSVHQRKILTVKDDRTDTFADGGLFGVFGLAWHGQTLWAATSALPYAANLKPEEKGRAGLIAFHKDGRPHRRVMLPADGKEHVLGDLTVARNGDIYASDSNGTNIYRLRANADTLETFHAADELYSPQGLALSRDESRLALADYTSGLHIIDVRAGTRRAFAMPPHTTLHGVDALLRHGRDLIAVQNGIDPQRIIRIRLNADWTAIEGVDTLAANLPDMSEPTLAVLDGNDLLIIGDGQWSRFNDDGTPKADAPKTPSRILRLPVPGPRE